jgi:hypothetical protein
MAESTSSWGGRYPSSWDDDDLVSLREDLRRLGLHRPVLPADDQDTAGPAASPPDHS